MKLTHYGIQYHDCREYSAFQHLWAHKKVHRNVLHSSQAPADHLWYPHQTNHLKLLICLSQVLQISHPFKSNQFFCVFLQIHSVTEIATSK